jgi:hypothetical protein
MKLQYILTLLMLLCQIAVFPQAAGKAYYVVSFKDKGIPGKSSIAPESCLSAKAIQRRERYNIPFDESDYPVNQNYLKTLKDNGATIISVSRWFNNAVVLSGQDNMNIIEKLPFVQRSSFLQEPVSGLIKSDQGKWNYFYHQPYQQLKSEHQKSAIDYGSALNQINMINGIPLHDQGFLGQGMTIAVLDAGFNQADALPVFDSIWINNQVKGFRNFVNNENVFDPSISAHGTMVLSTMAGNIPGTLVGTAPKADYWLLRSEDAPTEYILEEYFWVNAAEFADSVGADIINSSLGYTLFDDTLTNHTYADMDGNTTYITIGADKAASKGILVVNSAGNSAATPWHYIGAPADGDSVFSIGAVNATGNYAYFSSTGPTYDGRIKPTVVAQGLASAVYSPWGLQSGNGTSFSSPIMAGMSACLWQSAPSFTNMEIIESLKSSASQSNAPDSLLGWGIPNFHIAMGQLRNAPIFEQQDQLQVFPNPVTSFVKIDFRQPTSQEVSVVILDMQGREVIKRILPLQGNSGVYIDGLDILLPGLYIMRLKTGLNVFFERIIKS